MLYAVGTHIDLGHLNKPQPATLAAQFEAKDDRPPRKLYVPGTKILIVRMLPTFETITVAPAM